jgi:hypothetical protein
MKTAIDTFSIPQGWRVPKTQPMSEDWKARRKAMYAEHSKGSPRFLDPKCIELRRRLLLLGGEDTAVTFDKDIEQIIQKGLACKGWAARMIKGQPCRCHQNAGNLADRNPNVRVATGYALSPDGLWRCHSWAVDTTIGFSTSGHHVVETTERRVAYYGFMLTKQQCRKWWYDNCF